MPTLSAMSHKKETSIVVQCTNGIHGPILSHSTLSYNTPKKLYALEYLNEGGANFVFKILPIQNARDNPTTQSSDEVTTSRSIHGKLLRLRKDVAQFSSTANQYNAYHRIFAPIFSNENLVNLDLIKLSPELPAVLNSALPMLPLRPANRQHDFLPLDETFGLLVTDMTPASNDKFLQLKPKWLIQSPTAPQMSKRCRTCALRAQRASRQIRTATDAQENCPLKLVSEDIGIRRKAAECVTRDEQLQEFLTTNAQPLLRKLRDYQQKFDQSGVLGVPADKDETVSNLCKAMTLRDCTLFLRKSGETDQVEARLADLDLKQPEKVGRWMELESALIEDGWYTNVEDSGVWQVERICLLAQSGTSSKVSQ
nr:inositol-pentakisphosphate 2-kinase [Quercus suber]